MSIIDTISDLMEGKILKGTRSIWKVITSLYRLAIKQVPGIQDGYLDNTCVNPLTWINTPQTCNITTIKILWTKRISGQKCGPFSKGNNIQRVTCTFRKNNDKGYFEKIPKMLCKLTTRDSGIALCM